MPKKNLPAGNLRHRVRIEAPVRTQDETTGEMTTTWQLVEEVAASIEPLSARDFVAAQMQKSTITVRIVIRYRSGLNTAMRLVRTDGTIYKPHGFLHDMDSGREYLTVPCEVLP